MISNLNKIFNNIGIKQSVQEVEIDLPLAYQKKYVVKKTDFDGEVYLLIKENRRGTLENFVKQAEFISRKYNEKYILVFNQISEDEKKLLLKARIPFIDYKGNLFIPILGIILNKELEIFKMKQFTSSEQLVFTYILMSGLNYDDSIEAELIVENTQLSIATVYRVLKKFVKYRWLSANHGYYKIEKKLKDILIDAQEYLINPIKEIVYIDQNNFNEIIKKEKNWGYAGTYALSQESNLSENNVIIAMSASSANQMIKNNNIEVYESNVFSRDDIIELQLWNYKPVVTNEKVDFISLYLTLKDVDDPRIEKELQKLLEKQFNDDIFRKKAN